MTNSNEDKYHGKRFIRTGKIIGPGAAPHNKRRWDWIEEAGREGRTHSEIDAPDSIYRQCITRSEYAGNNTVINQDLNYDIRDGWIEVK
jgi:hypothetical protein